MEIRIKLYFKIYIFLIYIIVNISTNNNFSPNLAVIPFKILHDKYTADKNNFSPKDYIDIIHSAKPYFEIEVGTKIKPLYDNEISKEIEEKIKDQKQFLLIFILIDDYNFYIEDNYFYESEKNIICRYSSNLSSSYEIDENMKSKLLYRHSVYATDYYKIYSDLSLDKYNMVKILFRHVYSTNKNISFSCGKAGLLYHSEKQDDYTQTNFIHQIHSKLKGVDYSFMFKFNEKKNNKENEGGLFIAGAESYIKNNKNYEIFSIYTKTKNTMNKQEWRFKAEKMILGNRNIDLDDVEFVIKIENEGIEIPYSLHDILKKEIFKGYFERNICGTEDIYNHYLVTFCYCNNFTNNDIINFPIIKFVKNDIDLNLSFSGEELFDKKGNKNNIKKYNQFLTNKFKINNYIFGLKNNNFILKIH